MPKRWNDFLPFLAVKIEVFSRDYDRTSQAEETSPPGTLILIDVGNTPRGSDSSKTRVLWWATEKGDTMKRRRRIKSIAMRYSCGERDGEAKCFRGNIADGAKAPRVYRSGNSMTVCIVDSWRKYINRKGRLCQNRDVFRSPFNMFHFCCSNILCLEHFIIALRLLEIIKLKTV